MAYGVSRKSGTPGFQKLFAQCTAKDYKRGECVFAKGLGEELRLLAGDEVALEKMGQDFVVVKVSSKRDRLEQIIDWNPERSGRPESVSPKCMKQIRKA
jgi:hypothetical protein